MLLTRTFLAFLALSLTACETRVSKHGMIPGDNELALIKPGVHKRGDIRVILGPPSTIAEFEPKAWYYIGSEIQKEAFSKSRFLSCRDRVMRDFQEAGAFSLMPARKLLLVRCTSALAPRTRL